MLRTVLTLSLFLSVSWRIFCFASPDTIRVMHYNLLNYRNTTGQCTNSTNNPDDKDGYLSTIVHSVMPDVITVNEMGAHWLNPNKILTNALNVDGVTHFDQMEFTNNSFSSLTNMLFFNTEKLVKHKQEVIGKSIGGQELVRVTDVYTLYYKDEIALLRGDTTFLTFMVVHLKAGSGSDDKVERALQTEAIMDFVEKNKTIENYFICGDFNIQTHSEACYKNMVSHSDVNIKFIDPIDAAGSWNNNSNYANVHTQSTHVTDTRGGCFSSGGMDDRFDFVLCGKEVMDNKYGVQLVLGSYKALGQDSRRFNGDMSSPDNSLVSKTVSNALYNMSDHLPVLVDVAIDQKGLGVDGLSAQRVLFTIQKADEIKVFWKNVKISKLEVVDMTLKSVYVNEQIGEHTEQVISKNTLSPGTYIIFATDQNNAVYQRKIILTR